jgi:hypothetical protein
LRQKRRGKVVLKHVVEKRKKDSLRWFWSASSVMLITATKNDEGDLLRLNSLLDDWVTVRNDYRPNSIRMTFTLDSRKDWIEWVYLLILILPWLFLSWSCHVSLKGQINCVCLLCRHKSCSEWRCKRFSFPPLLVTHRSSFNVHFELQNRMWDQSTFRTWSWSRLSWLWFHNNIRADDVTKIQKTMKITIKKWEMYWVFKRLVCECNAVCFFCRIAVRFDPQIIGRLQLK